MVCYNVLWREYRRNEKVLKQKVLKQNNLLRLQKRLAVVMLALTLGLGTGCGKQMTERTVLRRQKQRLWRMVRQTIRQMSEPKKKMDRSQKSYGRQG